MRTPTLLLEFQTKIHLKTVRPPLLLLSQLLAQPNVQPVRGETNSIGAQNSHQSSSGGFLVVSSLHWLVA